jgi:hypothetical protein
VAIAYLLVAELDLRCLMHDDAEARIKLDLTQEIQTLQENYALIKKYLSGANYPITEMIGIIKAYKDSLNRASAFVLAFYNLRGQRVNIPWEPLFTSLDYALATVGVMVPSKQEASLRTILGLSEDQMSQVMVYFASLSDALT